MTMEGINKNSFANIKNMAKNKYNRGESQEKVSSSRKKIADSLSIVYHSVQNAVEIDGGETLTNLLKGVYKITQTSYFVRRILSMSEQSLTVTMPTSNNKAFTNFSVEGNAIKLPKGTCFAFDKIGFLYQSIAASVLPEYQLLSEANMSPFDYATIDNALKMASLNITVENRTLLNVRLCDMMDPDAKLYSSNRMKWLNLAVPLIIPEEKSVSIKMEYAGLSLDTAKTHIVEFLMVGAATKPS